MDPDLERRARVHACLGEPVRLAIVEDLALSDRAPNEIARRFDLGSNLVAHHLGVLEEAGLITRCESTGDRRRRYVRLRRWPLTEIAAPLAGRVPSVLFVCTHNSARSQLAAALWANRTGRPASSAGTHPAEQVHPSAIAAARRAGLDLAGAKPRPLLQDQVEADTIVTVCDRAHEELCAPDDWWHWSLPDPVVVDTPAAFDETVATLDARIKTLNRKESP